MYIIFENQALEVFGIDYLPMIRVDWFEQYYFLIVLRDIRSSSFSFRV